MLVLAALLQAPGMSQPPPPPPFPILALGRELGLSAEQHQAIRALLESKREGHRAQHEAAMQARQAFHRAMVDPARSAAEVEALQRQDAELHRAEALEAHALLVEAAKLLTPEQQAAYQRLSATLPPPPGPEGQGGRRGPMQGREPRPGPPPEGEREGRP